MYSRKSVGPTILKASFTFQKPLSHLFQQLFKIMRKKSSFYPHEIGLLLSQKEKVRKSKGSSPN